MGVPPELVPSFANIGDQNGYEWAFNTGSRVMANCCISAAKIELARHQGYEPYAAVCAALHSVIKQMEELRDSVDA